MRDDIAPPHNPDIERAVLQTVLDGRHPEAVDQLITAGGSELFFHRPHTLIARTIELLRECGQDVNAAFVQGAMARMSHADASVNGGSALRLDSTTEFKASVFHALTMEPWERITDAGGTWNGWAKNLAALAAIHRQRLALRTLSEGIDAISRPGGAKNLGVTLDALHARLGTIVLPSEESNSFTLRSLIDYPQSDPRMLLGNRWLSQGGSCLINGQTGIGKSSFCIQAAMTWAMGNDVFGIKPVRPLRSLIVQAENDAGDLADMVRGVITGMACTSRVDEINDRMRFVTDSGHSGAGFMGFIKGHIAATKPDLVWIDPLLSFIGGDISKQEVASAFLRNGLGTIAQETGVCWMIMHHTNKPKMDERGTPAANDYSYAGSGSAELANWARAIMMLREKKGMDRVYELRVTKRSRRSGMTNGNGQAMSEIYIRHADQGIHWERAVIAEDEQDDQLTEHVQAIMEEMEIGRIYRPPEIQAIMMRYYGVKKPTILTKGKPKRRIYEAVLASTYTSNGHVVTTRSPLGHVTTPAPPTAPMVTMVTSPLGGGEPRVTIGGAVVRGAEGGTVTSDHGEEEGDGEERTIERGLPPDNWATKPKSNH